MNQGPFSESKPGIQVLNEVLKEQNFVSEHLDELTPEALVAYSRAVEADKAFQQDKESELLRDFAVKAWEAFKQAKLVARAQIVADPRYRQIPSRGRAALPGVETRAASLVGVELRQTPVAPSVSGRTVRGLAARYYAQSRDLGGFVERILPGAFQRALRERQDVRGLINHDPSQLIGRTKSGTLRLKDGVDGLSFECDVPDTSYGNDLIEQVKRGDISQCSFSFGVVKEHWQKGTCTCAKPPCTCGGTVPLRELQDVDLFDVSPVTFPAYDDTELSMAVNQYASSLRAVGFEVQTPAQVYRTYRGLPALKLQGVETLQWSWNSELKPAFVLEAQQALAAVHEANARYRAEPSTQNRKALKEAQDRLEKATNALARRQ